MPHRRRTSSIRASPCRSASPSDFTTCGRESARHCRAGGRFSGQWYGPRDSWVGRPGITFLSRDEATALLKGSSVEMFEEEEADSVTPRGKPKHWHIFHIVARKR